VGMLLDPIDSLGPFHTVESDGRIFPAYAFDKLLVSRRPGPPATPWQLKKGDIVRIPLAIDGLHKSHTNWTVPMIRVGSTYLRVD
jgi:hypothetical protein